MTLEQLLFCFGLFLGALIFLAYKLWTYRCAIITLQADMTLVLNDLTRPAAPPLENARHMIRLPDSYEERLALHKQHEHAL